MPQFQCLGHQSWAKNTGPLLTKYPELDLTPGAYPENKGIYCREWDPTNPRVNEIVFALIDELIDAFDAKAFHVGMDEVFLLKDKHATTTKDRDPAEVFAEVVNDLHGHLVEKRGLTMLMWADRLIDGDRWNMGEWEASKVGTAPAVDKIPKDIILCPWHYEPREAYESVPILHGQGLPRAAGQLEERRGVERADPLLARAPARRATRRTHLHDLVRSRRTTSPSGRRSWHGMAMLQTAAAVTVQLFEPHQADSAPRLPVDQSARDRLCEIHSAATIATAGPQSARKPFLEDQLADAEQRGINQHAAQEDSSRTAPPGSRRHAIR